MSILATRRLGKLTTDLMFHQAQRNASQGRALELVQYTKVNGTKAAKIFFHYAKVELTPPMPQELPQVFRGFRNLIAGAKTGAWRNVTMREAWLNGLVTVEVLCWFFVGEIIGKGSLIGYSV